MVSFLNGNKTKQNESYKGMTELVKSILYWYTICWYQFISII